MNPLLTSFMVADQSDHLEAIVSSHRAASWRREEVETLWSEFQRWLSEKGNHPREEAQAAELFGQYVTDILAGDTIVLRLGETVNRSQRVALTLLLQRLLTVIDTVETDRQEAAIAKLADVLLPDPLADARGPLAVDNLELRDRFVRETRPLTSVEVARAAGYKSANRYATAARWKRARDIFSVEHRGTEYFPAFQFREGKPHPTVKKALAALPASLTPWQRAFWFVSTNGWLTGTAPAETLDDPDAVVAAAGHEGEEVMG